MQAAVIRAPWPLRLLVTEDDAALGQVVGGDGHGDGLPRRAHGEGCAGGPAGPGGAGGTPQAEVENRLRAAGSFWGQVTTLMIPFQLQPGFTNCRTASGN